MDQTTGLKVGLIAEQPRGEVDGLWLGFVHVHKNLRYSRTEEGPVRMEVKGELEVV
jgi:hypothetical protein